MNIQRGSIFHPEQDHYKIAGIVLMVSCLQFFMAVTMAETQYPGYSTAKNTLSSLGGTLPPCGAFGHNIQYQRVFTGGTCPGCCLFNPEKWWLPAFLCLSLN